VEVPALFSVSVDCAFCVLVERFRNTLLWPLLYAITPPVSPTLDEESELIFRESMDAPAVEESPV